MIYPIILSIVAVIVIIVMLVYIVPMYSDMFVDMEQNCLRLQGQWSD